jgi:hypothetical protein
VGPTYLHAFMICIYLSKCLNDCNHYTVYMGTFVSRQGSKTRLHYDFHIQELNLHPRIGEMIELLCVLVDRVRGWNILIVN